MSDYGSDIELDDLPTEEPLTSTSQPANAQTKQRQRMGQRQSYNTAPPTPPAASQELAKLRDEGPTRKRQKQSANKTGTRINAPPTPPPSSMPSHATPDGGIFRFTNGLYKGKTLDEVPVSYAKAYLEEANKSKRKGEQENRRRRAELEKQAEKRREIEQRKETKVPAFPSRPIPDPTPARPSSNLAHASSSRGASSLQRKPTAQEGLRGAMGLAQQAAWAVKNMLGEARPLNGGAAELFPSRTFSSNSLPRSAPPYASTSRTSSGQDTPHAQTDVKTSLTIGYVRIGEVPPWPLRRPGPVYHLAAVGRYGIDTPVSESLWFVDTSPTPVICHVNGEHSRIGFDVQGFNSAQGRLPVPVAQGFPRSQVRSSVVPAHSTAAIPADQLVPNKRSRMNSSEISSDLRSRNFGVKAEEEDNDSSLDGYLRGISPSNWPSPSDVRQIYGRDGSIDSHDDPDEYCFDFGHHTDKSISHVYTKFPNYIQYLKREDVNLAYPDLDAAMKKYEEANFPPPERYVIDFGKNKGKRLDEVEERYVKFLNRWERRKEYPRLQEALDYHKGLVPYEPKSKTRVKVKKHKPKTAKAKMVPKISTVEGKSRSVLRKESETGRPTLRERKNKRRKGRIETEEVGGAYHGL